MAAHSVIDTDSYLSITQRILKGWQNLGVKHQKKPIEIYPHPIVKYIDQCIIRAIIARMEYLPLSRCFLVFSFGEEE